MTTRNALLEGDTDRAVDVPWWQKATGYQIQVPLYLETDTLVKIDTRDGNFLGRVNS